MGKVRSGLPIHHWGLMLMLLALSSCDQKPSDNESISAVSDLFSGPMPMGELRLSEIDEASGLAASHSLEGYLWTHNDSGGEPSLYLVGPNGEHAGIFSIEGAQNRDWEDLAIGPGPENEVNYLYIGDIGDNNAVRNDLVIYRVPEPQLSMATLLQDMNLKGVDRIRYQYPDGARDCETLMIDPLTKDIILVTKREANVNVYRLPFPQSTTSVITAEYLLSLPITRIVGGDISTDGSEILMKTYQQVYHWARSSNQSIKEAFQADPELLEYNEEPQGEAIAWSKDGASYFTLSEERNNVPAVIYKYSRN